MAEDQHPVALDQEGREVRLWNVILAEICYAKMRRTYRRSLGEVRSCLEEAYHLEGKAAHQAASLEGIRVQEGREAAL